MRTAVMYANRLDFSQFQIQDQYGAPTGGWDGQLKDTIANNWGVTPDDVQWYVLTENEIRKKDKHIPVDPNWQGSPGVSAQLIGVTFARWNNLWDLSVQWVDGRPVVDENGDDVIYLRGNQTTQLRFVIRKTVDGEPTEELVPGNKVEEIPFMFDNKIRYLKLNFTDGYSQTIEFARDPDVLKCAMLMLPMRGYRNTRFRVTTAPIYIKQVLNINNIATEVPVP